MCSALFKNLMPDMTGRSVFELPYEKLRGEGVKGLIYDIDNTLVAVFHDLEQAKRCCTRAVMLKDGKIVFDGDIAEAMKTEMLMNIYDFDVASYFNY